MVINLVLADDEELFRVGIAHILGRDKTINILYEASNGKDLIDYLAGCEVLPDIVLTDIKMPEINGVEVTKIIHEAFPHVGIIALTTYNTNSFISNRIGVGASANLVKNSSPEKVIHTIKQVYHKGFYYDTLVMKILNEEKHRNSHSNKSVFDDAFFTPREKEILALICQQKTTQEISKKLYISPRTVDVHRKHVLEKAGVKNIAGLVIFAVKNDLFSPGITD
jgi:DNA-binding NarL/FixJ family response regulator